MKQIIIVLTILGFTAGCDGQQYQDDGKTLPDSSMNVPQTDIKVEKEYDDYGNLIRYDSVYSSYYSNIEGDPEIADSIFKEFREHFNTKYPFTTNPFFNDMFFNDSLLKYDFYKDEFFQSRFEDNWRYMEEYFRQMDSIKNQFFEKQFPKK